MKYITCVLFLYSTTALSQIATSSYFPAVKSQNPGVIAAREYGQWDGKANQTNVTKYQTIDLPQADVETEIKVKEFTFFKGGKGKKDGKTFTTEFIFDSESGEKIDLIKDNVDGHEVLTSKSRSNYIQLAMGYRALGIALARTTFTNNFSYSFSFGSDAYVGRSDTDLEYRSAKVGFQIPVSLFELGLYYDFINVKGITTSSFSYNNVSTPTEGSSHFPDSQIIALGLGYKGKKFHFELSYELMPFDKELELDATVTDKQYTPSRKTAVIEFKWNKLTLGAKVSQVEGTYINMDGIITDRILYNDSPFSRRLENSFLLAWGSQKGIVISGFASYSNSEVNEESASFGGTKKYPTRVKSLGFGLNVGYVY